MGIWVLATCLGSISLIPDDTEAEVTYWLGGAYTGKGYATLAVSTMKEYARPRFDCLKAAVLPGKQSSARVLERSGFENVGRFSGTILFDLDLRKPDK